MGTPQCVISGCPQSYDANQIQLGDYDRDGRADVWITPTDSNHNCTLPNCGYNVYTWMGNGFVAPIASPLYASDISGSNRFTYQVDLDGDGHPDTLMVDRSGSQ